MSFSLLCDLRIQNMFDPIERQRVLDKVLDKPKFDKFVSTIFALNVLVETFPESTKEPFRNKVFVKLSQIVNKDDSSNYHNSYARFEALFDKFVQSAESQEDRAFACKNLLENLPHNLHAFEHLNHIPVLSSFVADYPDLTDPILETGIFDLDREALLKGIEQAKSAKSQEKTRLKKETEESYKQICEAYIDFFRMSGMPGMILH